MVKPTVHRRRASWIGFFLVVLASFTVCRAEQYRLSKTSTDESVATTPTSSTSDTPYSTPHAGSTEARSSDESEASKAYKLALQTLATFPLQSRSATQGFLDAQPSPFLESLFPNQQGPIATIIRIVLKLRQQTWVPEPFRLLLGKDAWGAGKKRDELTSKAVKVVDLLDYAIELGHVEAMYKLAQISLFPPNPLLGNTTRAYDMYQRHAQLTGNSTSQSMLAFFYATGYKDTVPIDQAKALLYYTFAAHTGEKGAQMALGYRFWAGIGVNDDCKQALDWYRAAADISMSKFLSGPPGGRTLPPTTTRLSDLDGGVFGPGASVASTGHNAHRAVIKAASARQAGETWEDVLEYYMFNADRGEIDFAYRLGKIFYIGSIYQTQGGIASGGEGVSAIPRDFVRARQYFLRIAWQIWPRDSLAITVKPKKELQEDGTLGYAVASAGYLGRMYLRGEGVKQDFAIAKMWFERGAVYGEKECHNGLGIIWRDGLIGGKKDLKKANLHFGIAAGQELAEAQVNLGKHHYMKGEFKLAIAHLDGAIRHGSPFEPYYYLAQIHDSQARDLNTPAHLVQSSCAMAVSFFKLVAERGSWSDDLVREGEARWRLGTDNAREDAMLRWWIAAERGIECAQNNLAYILDQDKSSLPRLLRNTPPPSNDTARLALTQWTRSAAQRNVDALVKVGDYYYHGLGVADEPQDIRWEKAAAYYQSAVDTQFSALAMWNLGWMYENGIGVTQDFHLAKRHYDLALETNAEAYLPVFLSLIKLHIRSLWHTLMGGKNGLTLWPEQAPTRKDTRTLEGANERSTASETPSGNDDYIEDADDGQWYMGRARDELNKRRKKVEARHYEEEDPIEWARNRRNAENDRDSDLGPEDYFEAATTRGGRRPGDGIEAEEEDEFVETMLLVFLCLTVSLLIWLRGRWVERRRREEEERRAGGQGGQDRREDPVFPPGDPPREDWAVLR